MCDADLAQTALAKSLAEALEYRGSDAYRAFAALLRDLSRAYDIDLRHVKPEHLAKTQAYGEQCRALYRVLTTDQANDTPKL